MPSKRDIKSALTIHVLKVAETIETL